MSFETERLEEHRRQLEAEQELRRQRRRICARWFFIGFAIGLLTFLCAAFLLGTLPPEMG